jgi:hypothetical protein
VAVNTFRANDGGFPTLVKQLQDEVFATALAIKRSFASNTLAGLVLSTPVWSGQARANWRITLGSQPSSANTQVFNRHMPGGGINKTGIIQPQSTINQGIEILTRLRPGQPIYLTNFVPYIVRLNEGYSKQQPAGWIERQIDLAWAKTMADLGGKL